MAETELQVFLDIDDKNVTGKLLLAGKDTLLTVYSKEPVVSLPDSIECICQNGQKVSLLNCLSYGGGHASSHGEVVYNAQSFPHYVVVGPLHCTLDEKLIESVCFNLSNAEQLFWDITPWLNEDDGFAVGEDENSYSHKFSYSGPAEIFDCNTAVGKISAYHAPSFQGPSISGFSAENKILVSIKPDSPISIEELVTLLYRFKQFAEICSGKAQGVRDISFFTFQKAEDDRPTSLDLTISHSEQSGETERYATGYDMLAAPCLDREDFENLVKHWFEKDDRKRKVSLSRFSSNLKNENYYDSNRLVSAASLFEWFDSTRKIEIPPDIGEFVDDARARLSQLPQSDAQNRLLGILGNTGTETLHMKILRQLNEVLDRLVGFESFSREKAEGVISWSVKCRNNLVHGSGGKKVQHILERHLIFLTESLEVFFALLCLHTAGWDIRKRSDQHLRGHTRYCTFLRNFNVEADRLLEEAK